MKELLKEFGKFLIEVLKSANWKELLYKLCKQSLLPVLKKRVDDTSSKIDDAIYGGVEQLVEKFLAPPAPAILAEVADGQPAS